MSIEIYQVEMHDGRKVIHYDGFIGDYCGPNEDGVECGWSIEEGCGCGIGGGFGPDGWGEFAFVDEIQGSKYEFVFDLFERVQQFGGPITDEEYAELVADLKESAVELDMESVTVDTPCGMYWYELEG